VFSLPQFRRTDNIEEAVPTIATPALVAVIPATIPGQTAAPTTVATPVVIRAAISGIAATRDGITARGGAAMGRAATILTDATETPIPAAISFRAAASAVLRAGSAEASDLREALEAVSALPADSVVASVLQGVSAPATGAVTTEAPVVPRFLTDLTGMEMGG
jgi:hypothetical protein